MCLTLEGEDVGTNTVEEETVVRDDNGAAREIGQRVFESTEGFNVKVVGRFVEEKNVAAFFEQTRHVNTVAFTARQQSDFLLLVAAFEVERRTIRARVHFGIAQRDQFCTARDRFPNGRIRVEVVTRLVNVGQLHSITEGDGPLIWLFLTSEHFEQGRFTGAVRTDHTDDTTRRKVERQVFDQ